MVKKSEYLTIPELAEIMGMSRIAVYNRVKSGKIRAIRIGRNYAIPREEVLEKAGDITGKTLSESQKRLIEKAVRKTVEEYGEVLRLLRDT
jgi:excisionase family DNA binding protein